MLRCPACRTEYRDRWRCECGSPLAFADRPLPDGPPPDPATLDRRAFRAFEPFLPVDPAVTLGEGVAPLVDAPAWDATFALEYVSPTGSFKDRGAATTLSRALDVGADRVLEDSSGNAGAAIAAYAARAGLDAEIYVPADAKPGKLRAIERTGADLVRVEGSRGDVTDACVAAVERGEGWYASHAWNPAFLAGTATFAYDLVADREWSVPDAVVCPVGHGTLFLGAYRGFEALRDAGWTDGVPRLLAVQAAGVAPLVEAVRGSEAATAGDGRNDVADGVQIEDPVRFDELREAVRATDGDAVAVGADRTERALDRLHRAGFGVEPTAALTPAGLERLREHGVIGAGDDVVVPLTGAN